MFNSIAITLVGIIVTLSLILCCCVLIFMWRNRESSRFKAFFYRCCWNEEFINLFTLVFFVTTMYPRFLPVTFNTYLYMNRFPWWTNLYFVLETTSAVIPLPRYLRS
ncbi:unnamed protein product [Cylicocyclus nassatus]|uniref:Uncharacterized protein n=1 Tax=Cylicocyclus nassatus TaxID=53992 RepID=A0AA36GEF0_CYLNA|nr:unnamed protein product [Cylicocyclus nassatus]